MDLETEMNNKIIAEFIGSKLIKCDDLTMGYELPNGFPIYYKYYEPAALKFHSHWEWIMPVVEYIENGLPNNEKFKFKIALNGISIENLSNHPFDTRKICPVNLISLVSKMDGIYSAIIHFIQWHNQFGGEEKKENEKVD
jgi:hypothetical protein